MHVWGFIPRMLTNSSPRPSKIGLETYRDKDRFRDFDSLLLAAVSAAAIS